MRLTRDAAAAVERVGRMEPDEILDEYNSLLQHTEADFLDRGELLTLAAICLTMATPAGFTYLDG